MKRKHILLVSIGVLFLLFAGTVLYTILRDDDPYRFSTGLGEYISIAPDDSKIAFSYYVDGKESLYTANPNGTNVKKITNTHNQQERHPKYSPNGKKIVYLSKDRDGIQTLHVVNQDGTKSKQLTDNELQVIDAIFSQDGKTIFFVAVESKEFKKFEDSQEGYDLFSIQPDGKNMKKLTDGDYFTMNNLFLSADGKWIYFSNFDGEKERLSSYSLERGTVNNQPSILPKKIVKEQSFNWPQLSRDGKSLAFTEVSEESFGSSLYKYDLFLLDLKAQKVERLTDLKKGVTSPVFFQKENKIAFLEHTNYPKDPADYRLMTIDLQTRSMEAVKLDAPQSKGGIQFLQTVDRAVNSYTIAILYILLLSLLGIYLHYYHSRKAYLPSIVSFSIALITFVSSFAVAALGDAWFGMALGMVAAGLFACSIVVLGFIFIFKSIAK